MSIAEREYESKIEWFVKRVFGSISLIMVFVGVLMIAFGYGIAITDINATLGAMFGIWGASTAALGSVIFIAFTIYRRRSSITAESSRDIFSE